MNSPAAVLRLVDNAPFLPTRLTLPTATRSQEVEQLVIGGNPRLGSPGLIEILDDIINEGSWLAFFESEHHSIWENRTPEKHILRMGNGDYGIHLHLRHRDGKFVPLGEGVMAETNPGMLFKLRRGSDGTIEGLSGCYMEPSPFLPQFLPASRYHEFIDLTQSPLVLDAGLNINLLSELAWKAIVPHLTKLNTMLQLSDEGKVKIPFELFTGKESPLALMWSNRPTRTTKLDEYPPCIVSPYGDIFARPNEHIPPAPMEVLQDLADTLKQHHQNPPSELVRKKAFFETLLIELLSFHSKCKELTITRTPASTAVRCNNNEIHLTLATKELTIETHQGETFSLGTLPIDELERQAHRCAATLIG